LTQAAWNDKPSWYLIAGADRMIDPRLQREFAKGIGARATTLPTSHVPFLVEPRKTAKVILSAVDEVTHAHGTTKH
jgi:hypothetical protein